MIYIVLIVKVILRPVISVRHCHVLSDTVKPTLAVTSIKLSSVLKGHLFLILS